MVEKQQVNFCMMLGLYSDILVGVRNRTDNILIYVASYHVSKYLQFCFRAPTAASYQEDPGMSRFQMYQRTRAAHTHVHYTNQSHSHYIYYEGQQSEINTQIIQNDKGYLLFRYALRSVAKAILRHINSGRYVSKS